MSYEEYSLEAEREKLLLQLDDDLDNDAISLEEWAFLQGVYGEV